SSRLTRARPFSVRRRAKRPEWGLLIHHRGLAPFWPCGTRRGVGSLDSRDPIDDGAAAARRVRSPRGGFAPMAYDTQVRPRGWGRFTAAVLSLALLTILTGKAGAATYYVDNQNPAATDAGPGTPATPYRTISAAVTQHGGPGNTILVSPGTYREQVSVSASGAS